MVRYIGRSKHDTADKRLGAHLLEAKMGKTRSHKCNWINSVGFNGGEIVTSVLESELSWEESGLREIFHIAHYRSLNCGLTNMTDGGEGALGAVCTPETRDKMSAAHLGKIHSPESKVKMSAWQKGRIIGPLPAGHRAKIGASNTGKTHTPETKAKISAGNLGKIVSAESRAKMSVSSSGKIASVETRAKLSAMRLGKPKSSETRAKMSAWQIGRVRGPHSAEHRAQISASLLARAEVA